PSPVTQSPHSTAIALAGSPPATVPPRLDSDPEPGLLFDLGFFYLGWGHELGIATCPSTALVFRTSTSEQATLNLMRRWHQSRAGGKPSGGLPSASQPRRSQPVRSLPSSARHPNCARTDTRRSEQTERRPWRTGAWRPCTGN